ncbi:MAG: hypothetical protein PHE56_09130 [Bacteroidales bacterium]|nr:hypothetical protein [Bacteroidales bacterium]
MMKANSMNSELIKRAFRLFAIFGVSVVFSYVFFSCKPEPEPLKPEIELIFESGMTNDGDTVAVGAPLKFKIKVNGPEANITNFTVKKYYDGITKTVMDSGLNSSGFTVYKTFYQSVEDDVVWKFAVQDRNKNTSEVSLRIYKDPNSQFGGILEYPAITLGYQQNSTTGNFFFPSTGEIHFEDTATLFQELVDVLVYFNYREDNGVELPSPTFSSPGEEVGANTELYTEYYPFLVNWSTRNYTKWDIRADNGVSAEDFENAHNDSLLIVSYDDVWGKKKYKWANAGTIIPFQTAAGKKGIVKVVSADHSETGTITFSMKVQI